MKLPWTERVNAISINPEMASREDISRMAGELQAFRTALENLTNYQNGPPLPSYEEGWQAAMDEADKLLGDKT